MRKSLLILSVLPIATSLLCGCCQKDKIDYVNSTPQEIAQKYTDDGLKEFNNRFHSQLQKDYALKHIGMSINKELPGMNYKTLSDKTISNKDFKNSNVLIYVATTTCPNCTETIKNLKTAYKDKDSFKIIYVFPVNTKKEIQTYLKKNNLDLNDDFIVSGKENQSFDLHKKLEINKVPTLIYINKNNRISNTFIGLSSKEDLEKYYDDAYNSNLYEKLK